MGGDEPAYHALALHLLKGEGFIGKAGQPTAWRTPGLPLVLATVYRITGDNPSHARILLATLASLTAVALYGLALLLFGRRSIALLSGFGWALLPTSHRMSGLLLGEPLAAFCLTIGLLLAVYAQRRRSCVLAAAAGFVLGYAVLTRVFLLFGLAGPVIWLIVQRRRREAIVLSFAVLLLLGAWGVRNAVRLGTFTLSTQTANMWLGNNAWTRGSWYRDMAPQLASLRQRHPDLDTLEEAAAARIYTQETFNEVTHHPGRILWLLPRKILIFLAPSSWNGFDVLYALLLPFWIYGFWRMARDAQRRHMLWLLSVPIAGVLIVTMLTFGDPRFRHPVDPLFVLFGMIGLVECASWLVRRWNGTAEAR